MPFRKTLNRKRNGRIRKPSQLINAARACSDNFTAVFPKINRNLRGKRYVKGASSERRQLRHHPLCENLDIIVSAIVGLLTVVYALVKRPFAEAMAAAEVLNGAWTIFID